MRRNRITRALALFTGVVVATAGVAHADNVQNDVGASGVKAITAGEETVINYHIHATGGTCDAADGSSATVTVNAPAGVSASTGSLSFERCGVGQPVTFTSTAAGDYRITVSVADTAGSYNPAPAAFTLKVNPAPTPPANRPPVVVGDGAGDAIGVEGDTLQTDGAFSDPDGNPLTITKLEGPGTVTPGTDGSWSWTLATTDDISGSVTVRADDGKGGTITDAFDFRANNAAPVVGSFSTSLSGACRVSVSAAFSDAGSADTHEAVIDWDDGNTSSVVPATTPVTGSHTYTAAGTYTVNVAVADDDLGTGNRGASSSITTGNTASAILDPIKANGASIFKAGSSIPIKITVEDCGNQDVSNLAPLVSVVKIDSSISPEAVSGSVSAEPTNGKNMSWDSASSQYVYVLSSKKSQFTGAAMSEGTYRLTVSDPTIATPATEKFDIKK